MEMVLHAEMQLSTQFNDCWSAHVSFCHGWTDAMDGLIQSYVFKQKLQNCKPKDQPFCRRPQGETLGVLDTLF
jgi:hypothetical protein